MFSEHFSLLIWQILWALLDGQGALNTPPLILIVYDTNTYNDDGENTSVDYNVGGGKENADGGGGCEDAEDDQAEPVDNLENRGYC